MSQFNLGKWEKFPKPAICEKNLGTFFENLRFSHDGLTHRHRPPPLNTGWLIPVSRPVFYLRVIDVWPV